MKISFIYVTCPNTSVAKKISQHLIQNDLCACANIMPNMKSIYKWKGKIETAREVVLLLKTPAKNYKKCEAQIKKLHPYECPCIVELPTARIEKAYANWLSY